jgi:hypothetical protein
MRTRFIAGLSIAVLGVIAVTLTLTGQRSSAAAPPLVYTCSAQPCVNAQELEVSDANGAPVFSVGEYGGDAVFGDNRSVFPPSSVFNPSVVESYTDPATNARTHNLPGTCVAPEAWISPSGIYACHGGKFILEVRL